MSNTIQLSSCNTNINFANPIFHHTSDKPTTPHCNNENESEIPSLTWMWRPPLPPRNIDCSMTEFDETMSMIDTNSTRMDSNEHHIISQPSSTTTFTDDCYSHKTNLPTAYESMSDMSDIQDTHHTNEHSFSNSFNTVVPSRILCKHSSLNNDAENDNMNNCLSQSYGNNLEKHHPYTNNKCVNNNILAQNNNSTMNSIIYNKQTEQKTNTTSSLLCPSKSLIQKCNNNSLTQEKNNKHPSLRLLKEQNNCFKNQNLSSFHKNFITHSASHQETILKNNQKLILPTTQQQQHSCRYDRANNMKGIFQRRKLYEPFRNTIFTNKTKDCVTSQSSTLCNTTSSSSSLFAAPSTKITHNNPKKTGISNATAKRQAARKQQQQLLLNNNNLQFSTVTNHKSEKPISDLNRNQLMDSDSEDKEINTSIPYHLHKSHSNSSIHYNNNNNNSHDTKNNNMCIGDAGQLKNQYNDDEQHLSFYNNNVLHKITSNSTSNYNDDDNYSPRGLGITSLLNKRLAKTEGRLTIVNQNVSPRTQNHQKRLQITELEAEIVNRKLSLEISRLLYLSVIDLLAGEGDWHERVRPVVKKMIYSNIDDPVKFASLVDQTLSN